MKAVPQYLVKEVLLKLGELIEKDVYKKRKRIPIKLIAEATDKLESFAFVNRTTIKQINEVLFSELHRQHNTKSLPKEKFLDEVEFELNHLHFNRQFK